MSAESSCNLRLCKGIYRESPKIAIQGKQKINNNFIKLLRYSFENNIYIGIATHDLNLIEETYKIIKELNISTEMFEFQVLYGVPMSGWLEKHIENGFKVRVYVPFGKDWYAYSTRRLKENPDIAGYIFKNIFRK
jgi:proline dehydrogenase